MMLKKTLAAALLAVALVAPAQAQLKYLPGRDYQVLQAPLESAKAPKAIEFFWYGCPHCYDFEEELNQWIKSGKPADVVFEKVPVTWKSGAQMYYTAHALNLPGIDKKIFDAYHVQGKKNILSDKRAAIDFLVANGADRAEAEKAWDSLAVKVKMNRAKTLFDHSGLDSVPTFLVNGVYTVRPLKDFTTMLDTVTILSEQKNSN